MQTNRLKNYISRSAAKAIAESASAAFKKEDYSTACELLESLSVIFQLEPYQQLLLAKVLVRLEKFQEASDILVRYSSHKKTDLDVVYLKAVVESGLQNFELANERLVTLISKGEDNYIDALYLYAQNLEKLKNYEEAVSKYKEYIIEGGEGDDVYYRLAFCLWKLSNVEELFQTIEDNVDLFKNNVRTLPLYGFYLADLERYQESLEVLSSYIDSQHNEHNALAYQFRGLANLQSYDYVSAIEDFTLGLNSNTNRTAVLVGLGVANYMLNDLEKAENHFEAALDNPIDSGEIYYWLSLTKFELNNYPGAIASIGGALDSNSLRDSQKIFLKSILEFLESRTEIALNYIDLCKDSAECVEEVYYYEGLFGVLSDDSIRAERALLQYLDFPKAKKSATVLIALLKYNSGKIGEALERIEAYASESKFDYLAIYCLVALYRISGSHKFGVANSIEILDDIQNEFRNPAIVQALKGCLLADSVEESNLGQPQSSPAHLEQLPEILKVQHHFSNDSTHDVYSLLSPMPKQLNFIGMFYWRALFILNSEYSNWYPQAATDLLRCINEKYEEKNSSLLLIYTFLIQEKSVSVASFVSLAEGDDFYPYVRAANKFSDDLREKTQNVHEAFGENAEVIEFKDRLLSKDYLLQVLFSFMDDRRLYLPSAKEYLERYLQPRGILAKEKPITENLKGELLSLIEDLSEDKATQLLSNFNKIVAELSRRNRDGHGEPPPIPLKAPEVWEGKKLSGDPIEFLGKNYGQWLAHFNPKLDKNYLTIAQLKELDSKLYEGLSGRISTSKRDKKPIFSNGVEITKLSQLIERKLSETAVARISREYRAGLRGNQPD